MTITFYDLIGLTAPAMFLFAYLMVSIGKWTSNMLRFHLLNLLGAIAMLISLSHNWNLPTAVLECFWGVISVYGMVKAIKHKNQ